MDLQSLIESYNIKLFVGDIKTFMCFHPKYLEVDSPPTWNAVAYTKKTKGKDRYIIWAKELSDQSYEYILHELAHIVTDNYDDENVVVEKELELLDLLDNEYKEPISNFLKNQIPHWELSSLKVEDWLKSQQ